MKIIYFVLHSQGDIILLGMKMKINLFYFNQLRHLFYDFLVKKEIWLHTYFKTELTAITSKTHVGGTEEVFEGESC